MVIAPWGTEKGNWAENYVWHSHEFNKKFLSMRYSWRNCSCNFTHNGDIQTIASDVDIHSLASNCFLQYLKYHFTNYI